MLKPLRSNPLLDQTLRAGRRPSLRVTLALLIALLTGAMVSRGWLIDHMPTKARAVLLLLLWLLPLVTMAVAAISTARRLRSEGFQLVKQSPLTDSQVTWGLGLSTLYHLRVVLVMAFGVLPVLIDDTLGGGLATALCLAGLYLAASTLGTVLVLRWGRRQLGVVLTAIGCVLILALLPTLSTFASGNRSGTLRPICFQMDIALIGRKLHDPLPVISVSILPALVGWMLGSIPWRGREEGQRPPLEDLGFVLVVGLVLGLWVFDAVSKERWALVAIYQATGGENWYRNDGWLSNQSVCTWDAISCICGRVTNLDLNDNNLRGELPPEIGQLSNLQYLDLSHNQYSALPPEIRELTNLEWLDLSNNQLSELSSEIAQLASLQTLDLSGNPLSTLPPEIWQMTGLHALVLSDIELSELPPEIGQLTNLEYLHLYSNRLTELPPEIGHLTNLQGLGVSSNQLSSLPPEIGQLTNLRWLEVTVTQLADLPPEIGQLTNLETLVLYINQLVELPPQIGQLTNLKSLTVYGNQLSELPPEIGQLANLEELNVSRNQLTKLPVEIGQLTNLQILRLDDNQLTELPPEIGQLTNLRELDLSSNQLTELPPEIGQLATLTLLGLKANQLKALPPEFGQLVSLQTLYLMDNQIKVLPPEFRQLVHLQILDLSGNQLLDLPVEICQIPKVYIDLREELCNN